MKTLKYVVILLLFSATQCGDEDVAPYEHFKNEWIQEAFFTLTHNEFPRIKAISWWHENFDNSQLRVDSSSESLEAYNQGVANAIFITEPVFLADKLQEPASGVYHAAYPDFGGTEDVVTTNKITNFEALVGKEIAWAYFSNNWYNNIQFPTPAVNTIHSINKTPFIRIMPRTNFDEGGPDPNYTMQRIIAGDFDTELTQWALDAAATNIPLLVEFGTEVNGSWFPWNGLYNGAGETTYGDLSLSDGAERFRDAYRHIIDICNTNGANNITWFFHVDAHGEPNEPWNNIASYYPGDTYIDWLGISVYGPQEVGDTYQSFVETLNDTYFELTAMSNKPIAILEFAITEL
jgi:hypothetical protein